MNLIFDRNTISKYKSNSQIARVITESWVSDNLYCPHCGSKIVHFPNNTPVGDFYCTSCSCQYELKSKSGTFGKKIVDGAYDTMLQRIMSNQNPDFFLLNYSKISYSVKNFVFIPKHFFVPGIIEKRKPLRDSARRAGWIGCNILINEIPEQGMIRIIDNGKITEKQTIINEVKNSMLLEMKDINKRNWLFDVLKCINQIKTIEFTIQDIYTYENLLHTLHPDNNNVQAKIRQQLQFLRNKGFIEFVGKGKYKKLI